MSAPQLPGITPLPATLKAAANSALSRGWMDTEEKGSGQQQKQVAKGKEFAFKIYLAYDPPSPPSRPFALNASIFFLIGFGLSDSERGEGGTFGRGWMRRGPVTIHILIIWRLHLLLRGRHDSFTIAGAVAFLQHAWPSCLNNAGSVLRHHTAVKYWLNTRVRPERQESFLNRLFKII